MSSRIAEIAAMANTAPSTSAASVPGGELVIAVRGLTKIFKDFWGRPKARAVDNVDFEVRRGEVFGLLGPNGSGKSTTVKMLLGLLYPTRGHIEVFGHSPRHVASKSRIGYLPEESYLYRYLDSGETLDFFGSLFDLPPDERQRRSDQLLEMVGLNRVRRRQVGEFSKGMQRRIGLAQALINDPDLVILDEPTSGLDPIGCREVKDLILALAQRGKTVVLSSHLLADVEDVCDRVVVYYGGRIQAVGTLKDLLAEPDSLRITTPLLSRSGLEKVLSVIREEAPAGDRIRVETPTQNLESYFLGVVQAARENEMQTSGALSGSRVAAYLRGEAEQTTRADRVLDRLTRPTPGPEPEVTVAKPVETINHDLLKRLGTETEAPGTKEPTAKGPESTKAPVDLKQAEEKLSSLLRKPKP